MQKINDLIQKEMTRKEFLATLGFGAVTVMGFGTLLRALTGKQAPWHHSSGMSYGGGSYGGARKQS